MATDSCANCDTASTNSHPLRLCSACKTVAYCNRDCQKANWKAHKPSCRHSESKKAKEQASLKEIKDKVEDSLLPDGQLQFEETISIPHNSYLLKDMRPVPELPLGYKMMIPFPPEWLASISHLSAEEQEKAKTDWANQIEAMIEPSMLRRRARRTGSRRSKWARFRRGSLRRWRRRWRRRKLREMTRASESKGAAEEFEVSRMLFLVQNDRKGAGSAGILLERSRCCHHVS